MWLAVIPVISMKDDGPCPPQPDTARTWLFSLPGVKRVVVFGLLPSTVAGPSISMWLESRRKKGEESGTSPGPCTRSVAPFRCSTRLLRPWISNPVSRSMIAFAGNSTIDPSGTPASQALKAEPVLTAAGTADVWLVTGPGKGRVDAAALQPGESIAGAHAVS